MRREYIDWKGGSFLDGVRSYCIVNRIRFDEIGESLRLFVNVDEIDGINEWIDMAY